MNSKIKNILFVSCILALLVALGISFTKLKNYETLLHDEAVKNASLNSSLLYLKYKGIGDSLMIKGAHDDAIKFYLKADSILGEENLATSNKDLVIDFQKRKDSLENMNVRFNKVKNELVAFRNNKFKEADVKDSLLKNAEKELVLLNSKIGELRDSVSKAYKEIKKVSKSVGKIEISVLNGTKVYYAGDIENGRASGFGYGLFSTGGVYDGEWKNNMRHGKGKYTWKDGNIYEGDYYDDKRQGKGTYFFTSGEKYIGEWMDNKRNGKGTMYAKDGTVILSGDWENDEIVK